MPLRFSRLVRSLTRVGSGRDTGEPENRAEAHDGQARPRFTEEHLQIIDSLCQGDIVVIDDLPVLGCDTVRFHPTPDGAVLLTQTCDAVRPEKPTVAVAPVTRLEGGAASNARDGKILRYVHLPSAGFDMFVDLSVISTIDKERFITLSRKAGVDPADDGEVRIFGKAIGRRFGRFPFPDDVVPWLRPLEVVVQSKHDKNSPEGAAMRDVVELRVEATGGWLRPPYELTLCIIVKPGVIPAFLDDEEPPCPPDLADWLRTETRGRRPTSGEIATRLAAERRASPSSSAVYWLWLVLAEAWAARCKPDLRTFTPEQAAGIRTAVSGIDVDVVEESGFDLYRYRRSEQLDLDHLSPPTPM